MESNSSENNNSNDEKTRIHYAIKLLQQAISKDSAKEYSEALQFYTRGIEALVVFYKSEKNTKKKSILHSKINEYIDRATKIKTFLENRRTNPAIPSNLNTQKTKVQWEDIFGLNEAKEQLKSLIQNKKQTENTILYGPHGCGKSSLVKALAWESGFSFFSFSCSDIISKRNAEGDSRKVRNTFHLATQAKPAILLIEELEELHIHDSEIRRRVLTEILVQLQVNVEGLLVLGETSYPWSLDSALKRRFTKFIYVPLPDPETRTALFKKAFSSELCSLTPMEFSELGNFTLGYSSPDISWLVREVVMTPVREIYHATHFKKVKEPSEKDPNELQDLLVPCSADEKEAIPAEGIDLSSVKLRKVTFSDICNFLSERMPSMDVESVMRYVRFQEEIKDR